MFAALTIASTASVVISTTRASICLNFVPPASPIALPSMRLFCPAALASSYILGGRPCMLGNLNRVLRPIHRRSYRPFKKGVAQCDS